MKIGPSDCRAFMTTDNPADDYPCSMIEHRVYIGPEGRVELFKVLARLPNVYIVCGMRSKPGGAPLWLEPEIDGERPPDGEHTRRQFNFLVIRTDAMAGKLLDALAPETPGWTQRSGIDVGLWDQQALAEIRAYIATVAGHSGM